jgi:hypothetical protein
MHAMATVLSLQLVRQGDLHVALQVNIKRSGHRAGKLVVAIDSESMEEIQGPAARQLALEFGNEHGYGNAGLSNQPNFGAVDPVTDDFLEGVAALTPGQAVKCYRAEYELQKRL